MYHDDIPIYPAPTSREIALWKVFHRYGLVFAKDLPRPKKKIRAQEDLLPDLGDDDE